MPKEDIIWMNSVLNNVKDKKMPIVYVNHFPHDSSQRNWYEVMDRLKKTNLQLFLVGHLHQNHNRVFEGVPGIIGRTNTRGDDSVGEAFPFKNSFSLSRVSVCASSFLSTGFSK